MKNMKLRIAAALMLACVLLTASLSRGVAEGAGGKGTVIILDSPDGFPEGDFADREEAPFIPGNRTAADLTPRIPADEDDGIDREVFDIGDARVTVENTDEYPYSAIARMEITFTCGCESNATAFLVGPDRLLTAAHCLVCTDHSAWTDSITFYFGYKSRWDYLYKYDGRWTAYAGNLFKKGEYDIDYDYGCLKLEERVGDVVGWFGYRYGEPDRTFKNQYLYIAGYRDGILKYDGGYASPLGRQHIKYWMDMQPGNSGGPVYTPDYHALAINIAENNEYNIGYRLQDYVIEELDKLK